MQAAYRKFLPVFSRLWDLLISKLKKLSFGVSQTFTHNVIPKWQTIDFSGK